MEDGKKPPKKKIFFDTSRRIVCLSWDVNNGNKCIQIDRRCDVVLYIYLSSITSQNTQHTTC